MNKIIIQGSEYNFEEKTYNVTKDMSFKVNLVRYTKEEQAVCSQNSLTINIT